MGGNRTTLLPGLLSYESATLPTSPDSADSTANTDLESGWLSVKAQLPRLPCLAAILGGLSDPTSRMSGSSTCHVDVVKVEWADALESGPQ